MRKAWVRPAAGILAALCLSGCGKPAETVTPESAAQAAGQSFDVSAVIKMGGDALLEVAFDDIGTKKLMAKAAGAHMKKL